MKIRPLVAIARRTLWLVGVVTTALRVWNFLRPAPLTRSQEKQRRKQLIAEAKASRGKSRHATT